MCNTNLLVLINLFCLLLLQYNPTKKISHILLCKSCDCLGKVAFCIGNAGQAPQPCCRHELEQPPALGISLTSVRHGFLNREPIERTKC